MSIGVAYLLAASLWQAAEAPHEQRVATAEAACSRVTAVVTEHHQVPAGVIGYCDHIQKEDSPAGFFVLALRSTRECDYICSNLMGWFAVQASTGQVFDYEVGESRIGEPIGRQP